MQGLPQSSRSILGSSLFDRFNSAAILTSSPGAANHNIPRPEDAAKNGFSKGGGVEQTNQFEFGLESGEAKSWIGISLVFQPAIFAISLPQARPKGLGSSPRCGPLDLSSSSLNKYAAVPVLVLAAR